MRPSPHRTSPHRPAPRRPGRTSASTRPDLAADPAGPRRRAAGVLAGLLAAVLLAGCGSEDSSAAAGSGDPEGHNDADVAFATQMIPHHAQALSMVDLTLGRDLSPEVAELAEGIRAAQTPEIETMADWLVAWDEPVPETVRDHANAHSDDHGGDHEGEDEGEDGSGEMAGMMSAAEMDELAGLQGEEFERAWLEAMIAHHEGAVDMAEDEVAEGQHGAALDLARQIAADQHAEIEQMETLLAG